MFLQNLENLNGQGDRLAQEDEKLAGVPFEVIPKAAQDKATKRSPSVRLELRSKCDYQDRASNEGQRVGLRGGTLGQYSMNPGFQPCFSVCFPIGHSYIRIEPD